MSAKHPAIVDTPARIRAALDTELLLASGAMSGPYRSARPITSNVWRRLRRRLRVLALQLTTTPKEIDQ